MPRTLGTLPFCSAELDVNCFHPESQQFGFLRRASLLRLLFRLVFRPFHGVDGRFREDLEGHDGDSRVHADRQLAIEVDGRID